MEPKRSPIKRLAIQYGGKPAERTKLPKGTTRAALLAKLAKCQAMAGLPSSRGAGPNKYGRHAKGASRAAGRNYSSLLAPPRSANSLAGMGQPIVQRFFLASRTRLGAEVQRRAALPAKPGAYCLALRAGWVPCPNATSAFLRSLATLANTAAVLFAKLTPCRGIPAYGFGAGRGTLACFSMPALSRCQGTRLAQPHWASVASLLPRARHF